MKVIALLLLVGAIVISQTTNACDWEAAYIVFAMNPDCLPDTTAGNDYVKIISGTSTGAGNECYNETLLTRYTVYVGDHCGDENAECATVLIDGNNLSGTYEVEDRAGSCLKLCACTP